MHVRERVGPLSGLWLPARPGAAGTLAVLHGWRHNAAYMAWRLGSLTECYDVVCFDGPVELETGRTWFSWEHDAPVASVEALRAVEETVRESLRELPRPLTLLGYSQGGFVGAGAALGEPGLVDRLVVLKNSLVELVAPDAVAREPRNRALPILLLVSDGDDVAYPELGRESARRLRGLGMDVTLVEGDAGHDLTDREVAVVAAWLENRSPFVNEGHDD